MDCAPDSLLSILIKPSSCAESREPSWGGGSPLHEPSRLRATAGTGPACGALPAAAGVVRIHLSGILWSKIEHFLPPPLEVFFAPE